MSEMPDDPMTNFHVVQHDGTWCIAEGPYVILELTPPAGFAFSNEEAGDMARRAAGLLNVGRPAGGAGVLFRGAGGAG